MTKFIVRPDAWKSDVKLFFTITNSQIVHSRLLTHGINYKFMCLFAFWRWKLANERARISAVIVKWKLYCFPKWQFFPTVCNLVKESVFNTSVLVNFSLPVCSNEWKTWLSQAKWLWFICKISRSDTEKMNARHLRVIMRVTCMMISVVHCTYQDVAYMWQKFILIYFLSNTLQVSLPSYYI